MGIATVTKTVDGLELSATPHMAFDEGNRIFAELVDIAAPLFKLGGAKLSVSDGQGGRTPVAVQDLLSRLSNKKRTDADVAFLVDALSSLSMDDVIAAVVDAVRRLFLTDPQRASRLFLAILSNTYASVPAAAGGMQRVALGTAEAFRSIVGTSYRRQFAILAFALRVSFQDFFGDASLAGSLATAPA